MLDRIEQLQKEIDKLERQLCDKSADLDIKKAELEVRRAELANNEKDILIHEYLSLREEISRNQKYITTISFILFTTTSMIWGYGLRSKEINGAVFLAPFMIIIPSLFLIASHTSATNRIAAYIRRCIEPKLNFSWEYAVLSIRNKKPDFRPRDVIGDLFIRNKAYIHSIVLLHCIVSLGCFLMAKLYWIGTPKSYWVALVLLVAIVYFGLRRLWLSSRSWQWYETIICECFDDRGNKLPISEKMDKNSDANYKTEEIYCIASLLLLIGILSVYYNVLAQVNVLPK